MFEALRGLRDAVAPESGNLGGNANANNNSGESSGGDDFEEFWGLYRSGDPATVALVNKTSGGVPPTRREDMIRIHGRIEMEKDVELVTKLAGTVLEKSDEINERVSSLPGMGVHGILEYAGLLNFMDTLMLPYGHIITAAVTATVAISHE